MPSLPLCVTRDARPLPLPPPLQRRAREFDEMRDTPAYDLIVVMDRYDRAEVVREVRQTARRRAAGVGWGSRDALARVGPWQARPPCATQTLCSARVCMMPPAPPPPPSSIQVSVLERLNPGGAYLTRVHRLHHFARAGQLVLKDRCLLVGAGGAGGGGGWPGARVGCGSGAVPALRLGCKDQCSVSCR